MDDLLPILMTDDTVPPPFRSGNLDKLFPSKMLLWRQGCLHAFQCLPVWPELAKSYPFGYFEVFEQIFSRVYLIFTEILNQCGKFFLLVCKFSL